MTLFSAYEDFVIRTLGRLGGTVEKLLYLASVRDRAGEYCHWGLAKTFGQQQASEALARAHTEVYLDLLRTPIAALYAEAQKLDGRAIAAQEAAKQLLPHDLGGGTRRHFNSILLVLSLLSQAEKESTPRAA